MSAIYDSFSKLKQNCPLCNKKLTYKITVQSLENSFFRLYSAAKYRKPDVEVSFTLPTEEQFHLNDKDLLLRPSQDKWTSSAAEDFYMNYYYIKANCVHEHDCSSYELNGAIDELDFDPFIDTYAINPKKIGDEYSVPIELRIYNEQYRILNVHLKDNIPNGNLIKIINDYSINKTSFSMAEMNLDGTKGTWKEKRMDLVGDDFFKFDNPERIYSRINAIFLLQ